MKLIIQVLIYLRLASNKDELWQEVRILVVVASALTLLIRGTLASNLGFMSHYTHVWLATSLMKDEFNEAISNGEYAADGATGDRSRKCHTLCTL